VSWFVPVNDGGAPRYITAAVAPDGDVRATSLGPTSLARIDTAGKSVAWVTPLGGGPAWLAVADDGTTYVATDTGQLHRVSKDGAILGQPVTGSVSGAIGADGVVYTYDATTLYAYDAALTPKFSFPFGKTVRSVVIGPGKTLVLAAADGVYVLGE
jgi:outer membrane protein assembly factor BamB